jgi:hypothetical protein
MPRATDRSLGSEVSIYRYKQNMIEQFLIETAAYRRFAPIRGWRTRPPAVCIRTDRVHPIIVDYFVFGD